MKYSQKKHEQVRKIIEGEQDKIYRIKGRIQKLNLIQQRIWERM